MSRLPIFYSCERCPAYCCSYPQIVVSERDIARLAKHLGIDVPKARRTLTKKGEKAGERVLRHRKDDTFGTACRFLDRETRGCTVYSARPRICRQFPGARRCGYYDFLSFERRVLEDPEHVSVTFNK
jgi:Fe-S-cluster containining protein